MPEPTPSPGPEPTLLSGPWPSDPQASAADLVAQLPALLQAVVDALRSAGVNLSVQFSVGGPAAVEAPAAPSPSPVLPPGEHLTRLDRKILKLATVEPQTMGALARVCGHDSDSYFKSRVRRLKCLGLLVGDFDGYRRTTDESPEPPAPEKTKSAAKVEGGNVEAEALQALAKANGAALTAGQVAARAGHVEDEAFNKALQALARRGHADRQPDGYVITDAGRRAARS
jgi:hypothetical protein